MEDTKWVHRGYEGRKGGEGLGQPAKEGGGCGYRLSFCPSVLIEEVEAEELEEPRGEAASGRQGLRGTGTQKRAPWTHRAGPGGGVHRQTKPETEEDKGNLSRAGSRGRPRPRTGSCSGHLARSPPGGAGQIRVMRGSQEGKPKIRQLLGLAAAVMRICWGSRDIQGPGGL